MKIEKEYLNLEDVYEIRIFDAAEVDFYNSTPQEFDIEDDPIQELIFLRHTIYHKKMQKADY